METDPTSSDGHSKHSRSRTACRQCRQAKVKCGMETTPCLRCKRRGFDCEWDPGFKRSNNPDRFQHLEGHLRMLERKLGDPATHTPSLGHNSDGHTSGLKPSVDKTSDEHPTQTPGSHSPEELVADDSRFQVLNIKLTHQDAEDLFALYFKSYHPYIPMLNPSKSPKAYYQSSELLFWTIISIAARTSQPEKDFLAKLSPFLTTAVGRTLLGAPIRLPTIQAVLLLSLWPAYNVNWFADRSYVLSNFAVTAGTYLGLQTPFFEYEYTDEDENRWEEVRAERTRAWASCLIVANTISVEFGYSTKLPFDDRTIAKLCEGSSSLQIPEDLRHNLMLQRLGYVAFDSASSTVISDAMDRDDAALASILEKYDADLQNLEQPGWSLMNRVRLSAMRLFLLCMYFHLTTGHPARKPGVLKACYIAQYIINLIMAEDRDNELLVHSPRSTMRILATSAQIIFKAVHSSYGSELNYNSCKTLYNSASLCIHQQSIYVQGARDQPRRTRDILQELWTFGENDPEMCAQEPTLNTRTRLGASLIYDCLAIWRFRKRGERVSFGRVSETTSPSTIPPNSMQPSNGLDFPLNMDAFDDLVSEYLALPWDLNFNNGEFLY